MNTSDAACAWEDDPAIPYDDGTGSVAELLAVVRARFGVDFGLYRRPMVLRRIRGRMLRVHADTYGGYLDCLRTDPDEAGLLLERLTIKVSRFFRNAPVFDALRSTVLPELARKCPGAPLRVWSAGCGNGEEAYTMAIILSELAEAGCIQDFTILATDIDPMALNVARTGIYPSEVLEEVPDATRERWFRPVKGGVPGQWRVLDSLRANVSFEWHDITSGELPRERPVEAMTGCFHLVCCRNVVIYLRKAVRSRVQALLCDSVLPGGCLCLGEAEALVPEVQGLVETVDRRARLFRRVVGFTGRTV